MTGQFGDTAAEPRPLVPAQPIARRLVLGGLGGIALASAVSAAPASATIPTAEKDRLRLALISDTHINVDVAERTHWMVSVFKSIAARHPDGVLHCGDITDTGLRDEYAAYGNTIPSQLRKKIHYVPGNHEVRWDRTAKQEYASHFGSGSYSFDAAGVHFIGFDPTQPLQEPGHYGRTGLKWLKDDLKRVDHATPTILFQHYPMGESHYYLDDQEAVLDLLADHNVRGIIAGHIHGEIFEKFNGLTQLAIKAVRNAPVYYLADMRVAGQQRSLHIVRVDLHDDGSEQETAIGSVSLDDADGAEHLRPTAVTTNTTDDGKLLMRVDLATHAEADRVAVARYAQAVYGGAEEPDWTDLSGSGHRWRGSLDVSSLPSGQHRHRILVQSADHRWQQIGRYRISTASTPAPATRWRRLVDGSVQGGTVANEDVMVIATTAGHVEAMQPATGSTVWKQSVGPVYRRPAIDRDAVYMPAADHRLYKLDARTGHRIWARDLGAPVLSEPLLIADGTRDRLVVSAGQDLIWMDTRNGRPLRRIADRGFSAGGAAQQGGLVFTAAADGYARAHDLITGREHWSFRMRQADDEHHLVLYSGWDNQVLATQYAVLVSSVSSTWALDPNDGSSQWSYDGGGAMYAPAIAIDEKDVLLTTEWGVMLRIPTATGEPAWETDLGDVRVLNAGTTLHDGIAWAQTSGGELIGIRVHDGRVIARRQHSLAYCFGIPALHESLLVVGDQDGSVQAIDVSSVGTGAS